MDVFDSLSAFLQRVQDHARNGYVWYVAGAFEDTEYAKLMRFASKIEDAYEIDITRVQRSRRKAAGLGNVNFLGVKLKKKVVWILMASEGECDFHLYEKTKKNLSNKTQRLTLMGFELVQLTKPTSSGGGSSWTWRLTESAYKGFEKKIEDIAKNAPTGEKALEQAKDVLLWLPMFRGIRVQVGKLFQKNRRQWTVHHGDAPIPKMTELAYLKRQASTLIPLESFCPKI